MWNIHFSSPLSLGAVVLCFVLSCSPVWGGEIIGIKAEASSFKEWGAANFLVDGDSTTAWVGGRTGVGPAKRLAFTFPKARTIEMIRIANGNQGEGAFDEFRCMTRGILVLPDNAVYFFSLKPEVGEQDIVFPPVKVRSFEILIGEVAPPPDDAAMGKAKVAMSEVRVFSEAPAGTSVNVTSVFSSVPQTYQPKTVVRPKATKMDFFSAIKAGSISLRAAVPARVKTSVAPGVIDELVPDDCREMIRAYYQRLTTLHKTIVAVFAPSIRLREQDAMGLLRDSMRKKGQFEKYQMAVVDDSGIGMDKPVIRGNAAMVRVYGACRYSSQGKTFEYPVNALFSFTKESGNWLINGVQRQ